MAKNKKEIRELKEKAKKEEEKRKKRRFLPFKLFLTGFYLLTWLIAILMQRDDFGYYAKICLIMFAVAAIPSFFMMMFGTKRHQSMRWWNKHTWSFSEFGIMIFVGVTILNVVIMMFL